MAGSIRSLRSSMVLRSVVVLAGSLAVWHLPAEAGPPWASLIPFKRVDADAEKSYELEESHGPWLIMAASFAGPTAPQQAHDLVLELRQQFKLEAFVFQQVFDFSQPTEGLGFDEYGAVKKMRHFRPTKFEEIAVMVGHFSSIEDPELDKTLEKIKYAHPQVLDRDGNGKSQRMATLRSFYRKISLDNATKTKGPMGSAFVTRNPLLPEEYFNVKGLEPFVADMNRDLAHSLLNCPGKYTVRVASFRGVDTMKPAEFEKLTLQPKKGLSKIDEAALKASRLCAALREKGVEAYEFHDRTESIVTIGSFNSVGSERPDGRTEINPAVHQVMKDYAPVETRLPGQTAAGLAPRMLAGIAFDTQPLPVEVPKESIGAAYNQSKLMPR